LGGTDVELPYGEARVMTPASLAAAVKMGKTRFGTLTRAGIARSARRLLRPTFELGEMDGPVKPQNFARFPSFFLALELCQIAVLPPDGWGREAQHSDIAPRGLQLRINRNLTFLSEV
jgi:hypothetical protein